MTLYINTASKDVIEVAILKNIEKEYDLVDLEIIVADRNQSEILLPSIEKIVKRNKISFNDLSAIVVNNNGGSFTSLRIGVLTANALAYAISKPLIAGYFDRLIKGSHLSLTKLEGKLTVSNLEIIKPIYDKEPNIGNLKPVDK